MKHRREYVGRQSDPDCIVEDAPTVPDIPVEWLEELADYARSEWDYDTCEGIRIVLEAWQKEQEAR